MVRITKRFTGHCRLNRHKCTIRFAKVTTCRFYQEEIKKPHNSYKGLNELMFLQINKENPTTDSYTKGPLWDLIKRIKLHDTF